jgi:hypothetical protein
VSIQHNLIKKKLKSKNQKLEKIKKKWKLQKRIGKHQVGMHVQTTSLHKYRPKQQEETKQIILYIKHY